MGVSNEWVARDDWLNEEDKKEDKKIELERPSKTQRDDLGQRFKLCFIDYENSIKS
jgi:hypothetical protein